MHHSLRRPLLLVAVLLILLSNPASAAHPDGSPWPKVELYTTDWCPHCVQTKAFFDRRGIPYTLYDVEKSREASYRKKLIAPGTGVPVVVIDGIVIPGYAPKAFLTALDLDD